MALMIAFYIASTASIPTSVISLSISPVVKTKKRHQQKLCEPVQFSWREHFELIAWFCLPEKGTKN